MNSYILLFLSPLVEYKNGFEFKSLGTDGGSEVVKKQSEFGLGKLTISNISK